MKKTISLMAIALCIGINFSSAQTVYNKQEFKTNPVWIQMLDDENTNYFTAVEAFDTYWKFHEKPNEENEEREQTSADVNPKDKKAFAKHQDEIREQEKEKQREAKKGLREKDLPAHEWKREMTFQVKRFNDWKLSVQPFVQNDGRILTEKEREQMWQEKVKEAREKK